MTDPYVPPPDYLPQILPATFGMAICVMAVVELTGHLKRRPVIFTLLPLCLLALAEVVVVLTSLPLWFAHHDFTMLIRMLITVNTLRALLNCFDTYIYVQRARSILTFHRKWMKGILSFLAVRWMLLMVLLSFNFRNLVVSKTAADLFGPDGVAFNNWSRALNLTNLISPAAQAVFVDGSLMYVIVHTIRTAGRTIGFSTKRLTRIAVLIFSSVACLLLSFVFPSSIVFHSLVVSASGNIVMPLSAFVNIDLYILDINLFSADQSNV